MLSFNTLAAKQILIKSGFLAIAGITVTTSAQGVYKVAKNLSYEKSDIPEVGSVLSSSDESNVEISNDEQVTTTNNTPKLAINNPGISPTLQTPNIEHPVFTAPVTQKINTANSNQNQNACIVTISGNQYDVTTLQNTHSGGNIFNCGTDMTSVYQSQHGSNLSRMQQYLITNGSTTTNANTSSSSSVNNSREVEHEDEDEHEEESLKKALEEAKHQAEKDD